jgi:putative ABC transport system substrate-binding protein
MHNLSRKAFVYALTASLLLLGFFVGMQGAHAAESLVIILSSKDSAPYKKTEGAFKKDLKKSLGNVQFETHYLAGDGVDVSQIVADTKKKNPALIYTLGSKATRAATKQIKDLPIIASFVMDDRKIKGASNATAVVLAHSVETQLQWLKKLLPKAHTLGVLYNPGENAQRIEVVNKQAEKLGLKLIAIKVGHPRDLPGALKDISKQADVLLGIPDKVVLSRKTAKEILLASFQNRIPFVGLSSTWVKGGAIYALDRDYQDIGEQSGQLAMKILQGTDVNTLPPETPRKVVYAFNRKALDHMKIDIPKAMMKNATRIFE